MSLSVALPSLHATNLTVNGGGASNGGSAALSPTFSVGVDSLPSPTSDRVEWSRSTILDFIEDYRMQRVLWDPNTKGYHIKQTKYEALKLLGNKYGTEIRSIRSKIKSLRSSFHREHGKVMIGRQKGVHYQPMWFAYDAIRFILDGEGGSSGAVVTAARVQHTQVTASGAEGGEADEVEEKLALLPDDSVDGGGGGVSGGGDDGGTESTELDDKYATTMEAAVRAIQAAALAGARECGSGSGGAAPTGGNGAAVAGTTVDELKVEPQATNVTSAAAANATKTTATPTTQLPATVVYGMKSSAAAAAAAAIVANTKLFNAANAAPVTTSTTSTTNATTTTAGDLTTTTTAASNTQATSINSSASTAASTTTTAALPHSGNSNSKNNNNNNTNNMNMNNAMAMMTMTTPALTIIGSAGLAMGLGSLATMTTAGGAGSLGGCGVGVLGGNGATVGGTTMSHTFGGATPLHHAAATVNAEGDDSSATGNNNLVARVAAAVAAAAAANAAVAANVNRNVPSTIDEQQQQLATARSATGVAGSAGTSNSLPTTATDYEADIQSFCCNISADDVKTEITEGDAGELVMLEQQHRQQQQQQQQQLIQQQQQHHHQHPHTRSVTPLTAAAVNYYKLPPMAELPMSSSVVGGRKRKLMSLHADVLPPAKQPTLALQQHLQQHLQMQQQLQQQQQQLQQQQQAHTQHSNAQTISKPRERDLLPVGVAGALTFATPGNNHGHSSHSHINNSNNTNNNNANTSHGNVNSSNLHNPSSSQNPKSNNNNNNNNNASSNSSSSSSNNNNANSNTQQTSNDEYGVFGEYVAITIRKLKTPKAKIVIKHLINNLLYEAELGKYDHGMPSSKEPPQLYKM